MLLQYLLLWTNLILTKKIVKIFHILFTFFLIFKKTHLLSPFRYHYIQTAVLTLSWFIISLVTTNEGCEANIRVEAAR